MTLKAKGMIHISLAWMGSGGVGLSQVCISDVTVIKMGNRPMGTPNHTPNAVSGAAKSCTHPTHGALRISTEDNKTQYRAMKKGI